MLWVLWVWVLWVLWVLHMLRVQGPDAHRRQSLMLHSALAANHRFLERDLVVRMLARPPRWCASHVGHGYRDEDAGLRARPLAPRHSARKLSGWATCYVH